jgi:hypothetical protein
MSTSDPMGPDAGRILLNGNAESVERFCTLAHLGAGPSRQRDPALREKNQVVLINASWGRGEGGDGALRRGFAAHGRTSIKNLGLYRAFVTVLRSREVVRSLFDEHEKAWESLYAAYGDENDVLVAALRRGWERCENELGATSMHAMLHSGDRHRPGPPTRPVMLYVERAFAQRLQRQIEALVQADDRRAGVLTELWQHFHLAAGLDFDPLWLELRAEMAAALLEGSLITLTGGDPAKLLIALRFFRLEGILLEAVRRGVHIFGSSAGAMVLGRRVVVFHDRRAPRQEFQLFDNGIGLVGGFQVFPHVNDRLQTEDPNNLAYLAARFRHRASTRAAPSDSRRRTGAGRRGARATTTWCGSTRQGRRCGCIRGMSWPSRVGCARDLRVGRGVHLRSPGSAPRGR